MNPNAVYYVYDKDSVPTKEGRGWMARVIRAAQAENYGLIRRRRIRWRKLP